MSKDAHIDVARDIGAILDDLGVNSESGLLTDLSAAFFEVLNYRVADALFERLPPSDMEKYKQIAEDDSEGRVEFLNAALPRYPNLPEREYDGLLVETERMLTQNVWLLSI